MFQLADHLQAETVGDVLVITFLDRELRSQLVEALRPHALQLLGGGHRNVLLDLSNVTFLESTALGLIIQLGSRLSAKGGRLELCGAHPDVARLFTGPPLLPFSFVLYPDRAAALQKLNAQPAV